MTRFVLDYATIVNRIILSLYLEVHFIDTLRFESLSRWIRLDDGHILNLWWLIRSDSSCLRCFFILLDCFADSRLADCGLVLLLLACLGRFCEQWTGLFKMHWFQSGLLLRYRIWGRIPIAGISLVIYTVPRRCRIISRELLEVEFLTWNKSLISLLQQSFHLALDDARLVAVLTDVLDMLESLLAKKLFFKAINDILTPLDLFLLNGEPALHRLHIHVLLKLGLPFLLNHHITEVWIHFCSLSLSHSVRAANWAAIGKVSGDWLLLLR